MRLTDTILEVIAYFILGFFLILFFPLLLILKFQAKMDAYIGKEEKEEGCNASN